MKFSAEQIRERQRRLKFFDHLNEEISPRLFLEKFFIRHDIKYAADHAAHEVTFLTISQEAKEWLIFKGFKVIEQNTEYRVEW